MFVRALKTVLNTKPAIYVVVVSFMIRLLIVAAPFKDPKMVIKMPPHLSVVYPGNVLLADSTRRDKGTDL